MPRVSLEYQREINPGGGTRLGWPPGSAHRSCGMRGRPCEVRPGRAAEPLWTQTGHTPVRCRAPTTSGRSHRRSPGLAEIPAALPAGPAASPRPFTSSESARPDPPRGAGGAGGITFPSVVARAEGGKSPSSPRGRGSAAPGRAHPGAGHPQRRVPLGRGASAAAAQGSPGPGGSRERAGVRPAVPVLSAPSPAQGAAERREGAAQAAGAAGHGAAAQAVALQAPRQPIPHQDGEDSAGPRLPDDPGAGKEGNLLTPPPKAALRRFMDGRDGDSICQSSPVS